MTILTAPATTSTGSDPAALTTAVKHVAGMLWYEMLSELDATSGDSGALGTGADAFQGLFNWDIAQSDFGKYDSRLAAAAVAQMSHQPEAADALSEESGVSGAPVPSMLGIMPSLSVSGTASSTAAQPAAGAPAASAPVLPRAEAYAQQIWPQITAAAQKLGVPPVAILAQSALETGWGAAAGGNNLFGIKAAPGQPATTRPTYEMVDGVLTPQTAAFRDYETPSASIDDYVNLIQTTYQPALGQNSVAGFAQTLQSGGYATDQNYAAKILAVSQSPLMRQVLQTLPAGEAKQTSDVISE